MKRLYIPLPDAVARKQIVLNLMKQQPFSLSDEEVENVCVKSEGEIKLNIPLCNFTLYMHV